MFGRTMEEEKALLAEDVGRRVATKWTIEFKLCKDINKDSNNLHCSGGRIMTVEVGA